MLDKKDMKSDLDSVSLGGFAPDPLSETGSVMVICCMIFNEIVIYLCYLICFKHLIRSRAAQIGYCFPETTDFSSYVYNILCVTI